MKHIMRICLLLGTLGLGSQALADTCYADYKAKQDDPLRLHYGVMEIRGSCSKSAARAEVSDRLAGNGWILLNIVSVFGPEGLDTRKDRAGKYHLRF